MTQGDLVRDPVRDPIRTLLADIDAALAAASPPARARIFGETVSLFLHHARTIDTDAVALFGAALLREAATIDLVALSEASARLAPVASAPPDLIRWLAGHDSIAVAGPVLTHAPGLATDELLAIAAAADPAHLLAIAGRAAIEEPLSAILVARGAGAVIDRLATNPGARFTIADFGALLGRASADDRARVKTRMPVALRRFDGGLAGYGLMIDVSPGGAKLLFEAPVAAPPVFTLEFLHAESRRIRCAAVWRRDAMLGLRFTESLVALWDDAAAQKNSA